MSKDLVDLVTGSILVDLPSSSRRWGVSERNVEDSSVFRGVDVFAGKHGVTELLDARLTGEVEQRGEDLVIDQVLRVVEEDGSFRRRSGEGDRVLGESVGVLREQVLQDELGGFGGVKLLELLPSLVFSDVSSFHVGTGESLTRSGFAVHFVIFVWLGGRCKVRVCNSSGDIE